MILQVIIYPYKDFLTAMPNIDRPTVKALIAKIWERIHQERANKETVQLFRHSLVQYEARYRASTFENRLPEWYSRARPIIQSTGSGKSSLTYALSDSLYTARFTIRKREDQAFPPRDPKILEWLREGPAVKGIKSQSAEYHAKAIDFPASDL